MRFASRWLVLLKIITLLILGAIVNVAVAWGCVTLPANLVRNNAGGEMPVLLTRFAQQFQIAITNPDYLSRVGYQVVRLPDYELTHISAGFPLLAVEGVSAFLPDESDIELGIEYPIHRLVVACGISWPSDGRSGFAEHLPLRPLWPGFAINTIFYGAILWVVFFAPGMVKRTLRRGRGLCQACAYPVGASAVCTECGAKLPSPSR